ncbi:MAG: hypothetical protein KME11_13645 [Timaviella obliquedivisa GSE-PSE-MK23-08B]|nr:hypothetical protein [Timaviella obliquedivisa GSE-PSE-MK23-08B]
MTHQSDFFSPCSRYYGEIKPQNLAFNANLQEFANRVTLICGLETNGKMTPEEAYRDIALLWNQLKRSKKELGIGLD